MEGYQILSIVLYLGLPPGETVYLNLAVSSAISQCSYNGNPLQVGTSRNSKWISLKSTNLNRRTTLERHYLSQNSHPKRKKNTITKMDNDSA
ncbi:hypothetical protein SNE40_015973 [Patella caerulea]|uniref:Uncharacterized protein n=1 Tax=Patella caerulea TaxID=87958 RepID=A0AAN8J7X4_PATCE